MNDWSLISVEDGLAAIIDYRGKTPPKSSAGIPLISAANVKKGRVVFGKPEYISPDDYGKWTTRGFTQSGDVLITTEAPVGEVAPYPKVGTFQISRRVMALRADEKFLHHGFLLYALQSRPVQAALIGRNRGTTVARVLKTDITGLQFLAPTLEEQRRIAAVLGALDDKIELNRKMSRTLEGIAQAIFKSWFIDFDGVPPEDLVDSELGPIPKGWDLDEIGNATTVVGGGTPSTKISDYWEGGCHCWTTPKDLSSVDSPVLLDTARRLTDAGLAKVSSGLLPVGTFLLSSRAPVGYTAIAGMPLAVNQGYIAIPPGGSLSPLYLLHWTRANLDVIKGRAGGTTFQEISKRNFRPIPVVVPPEERLARFDETIQPLFDRITLNVRESVTLRALREALLPKLISGVIRVPELKTEEGSDQ